MTLKAVDVASPTESALSSKKNMSFLAATLLGLRAHTMSIAK
jgi:hypothetical protein